jgi:SAM-dependent methyltransferase
VKIIPESLRVLAARNHIFRWKFPMKAVSRLYFSRFIRDKRKANNAVLISNGLSSCAICGGTGFKDNIILDDRLISDWNLTKEEVIYVNKQQGTHCTQCGSNLRSIVLGKAICSFIGWSGTLSDIALKHRKNIEILELNAAGSLHSFLKTFRGHVYGEYPDIDMCNLSYNDDRFDIVVHSDTLEHINNPLMALSECFRVVKPGGACIYTVPTIIGRMSKSRSGEPKSYHGDYAAGAEDYVVHTEFGADMWTYPCMAGFSDIKMTVIDFPAAIAITAYKAARAQ